MSLYSDENRLKLAKWVKYFLIIDILIYCLFVILPILINPSSEIPEKVGENFIPSIVGGFVTILIYEKLQKPEDDGWRNLAELLASIQIFFHIILYSGLIAIFGYAVITGSFVNSFNSGHELKNESSSSIDRTCGEIDTKVAGELLFEKTNQYRIAHGRRSLIWDQNLETLAIEHSNWMMNSGVFMHSSDVHPQYKLSKTYIYATNVPSGQVMDPITQYNTERIIDHGENIYKITAGFCSNEIAANDILTAWKNSPEHNANLLNSNYTKMGIGIARKIGWGTYATQNFI